MLCPKLYNMKRPVRKAELPRTFTIVDDVESSASEAATGHVSRTDFVISLARCGENLFNNALEIPS